MRNRTSVAPLVGAWIEIGKVAEKDCDRDVAPLVGAWIEIIEEVVHIMNVEVAPLVGAWIEISTSIGIWQSYESLLL